MVANQLYDLCEAVGPEATRLVDLSILYKYYNVFKSLGHSSQLKLSEQFI